MIIAVVNQKGGAGKTSTLYGIAGILSESSRVAVLDTDPQASLSTVHGMRTQQLPIDVFQAPAFPTDHPALTSPYALIDTPPGNEGHTWRALGIADLALVPITPSSTDLLAALPILDMVKQVRKDHHHIALLAVLNQVKAGSVIPTVIGDMARDRGLPLAKTTIPDTVAMREATLYGLPLNYHSPHHPAVEAFRSLVKEIMEALRHGKK